MSKVDGKLLSLKDTVANLKYIAESPPPKYGGFKYLTILVAKSALHHIKILKVKRQLNVK